MLSLLVANQNLKERNPAPGETGDSIVHSLTTIPRLTLGTRDTHSLLSVLADDIVRIIMLYFVLNPCDRVAAAAHSTPTSLPHRRDQGGILGAVSGDLGSDTSSDWSVMN